MPSNYAGLNVLHGQITIPSDGDPAVAESVNVALRDLMDNTVNANTELGFKVDTRGTTAGLTGNITLTGAGRIIQLGTEYTVLGVNPMSGYDSVVTVVAPEVTFASDLPFGSQEVAFRSTTVYLTPAETFIGSGTSHELTVEATSTFNGPVTTNGNTTLGSSSGDTLTVNATSTFTNNVSCQDNVVLGASSVDTITVFGGMHCFATCQVDGVFVASNDVVLGSASGDDIQINGTLTVDAEATFESSLTVNSNVSLGDSTSHTVEIHANLETFVDTTIGNSSSDDLTINAALVSPLTFRGAGRVGYNPSGIVTSTTTLTAADGNFIVVMMASSGQSIIISSAGSNPGDSFFIHSDDDTGFNWTLQLPNGNTVAVPVNTGVHDIWVVRGSGSTWYACGDVNASG